MSKYQIPDDHWESDEDEQSAEWRERTSADVEVEVTLHNEGYQTDRRWTVNVKKRHQETPTAIYAAEHQNKGNFWREPNLWRDAVDFVDLPSAVRKRVADILNRSLDEITPEERLIHLEDGTGVGDRARESNGQCEVCGGKVYEVTPSVGSVRHKDCVEGDSDV